MRIFKAKSNFTAIAVSHNLNNYRMLDIVKYIAAIMVICVHCDQLFSNEFLNFFIKNIICRIAVPLFFLTSAYFVRKGSVKNVDYVSLYLRKTMKSYVLWSMIFMPIGLDWVHQNLALTNFELPFALLYGIVYIGTYYHLWYIPALIFSIFLIHKLLKHISYKLVFVISLSLYIFGSLESYYGLIPSGIFKDFFDLFTNIMFTTRSGLFYGMIFILMGFFIYDYQEHLKAYIKYIPFFTILCAILLIIEGSFLFTITRLDMNFLFALIPLGFFFFLWILSSSYQPQRDTKHFRELAKYYYFVHPICIVIVEQIGVAYGIDLLSSGVLSFILVVASTHLLSKFILKMKASLTYFRMLFSGLCGVGITFILVSIFFLFKAEDIVIKFEFVPCIWLASSFIICYFISLMIQRRQKYWR